MKRYRKIKLYSHPRYKTHHAKCFLEDPTLNPDDFTAAHLDKDNADWDKLYERFDAAVDWPTVGYYKHLLKKYPDAKVILTIRSADSWYESIRDTVVHSFVNHQIQPDHPHYAFSNMCRIVTFDGAVADPEQFNQVDKMKKMFNDHNDEVKRVVPADQLYVMPLGSGWEDLCKFLGKEVPKEPYPRSNSKEAFRKTANLAFKQEKLPEK